MKLPYREGTWFAVPLRRGGFAVAVVARAKRGGLLCYFFGPRRDSVPTLTELENLKPLDAICRLRVGDLGLLEAKWPIIGQAKSWNRSDWPMPVFIRREPVLLIRGEARGGRAWRVYYSDADPNVVVREEPQASAEIDLPADGLFGAGAAEIELTELLA
jgi:hypothetical protein